MVWQVQSGASFAPVLSGAWSRSDPAVGSPWSAVRGELVVLAVRCLNSPRDNNWQQSQFASLAWRLVRAVSHATDDIVGGIR